MEWTTDVLMAELEAHRCLITEYVLADRGGQRLGGHPRWGALAHGSRRLPVRGPDGAAA